MNKECIFCKIAQKEIPSHFIWEDEKFAAFLDINPINPGHMLIVPKEHIGYIFDLDNEMYKNIFLRAKQLSEPLKKAVEAKRIGMAVEGFGVDHVHLHLVPVNSGNELDPNRAKKIPDEELKQIVDKIRQLL